jgi:hypothetical protein
MASDGNQPPLKSERPSWQSYHDIPMRIGEALRMQYEPPQELPHQLLTLLMQVTGQQEND